jgi:hypothetical protein
VSFLFPKQRGAEGASLRSLKGIKCDLVVLFIRFCRLAAEPTSSSIHSSMQAIGIEPTPEAWESY